MRSRIGKVLVVLCLGVVSAGHSQPALAFTNGAAADLVLGQPDFMTGSAATTSVKMNAPTSVAVDAATGKVFVGETNNNRVLRFASLASLSNGSAAEAALGQPDFTSSSAGTGLDGMSIPLGVHVDSGGRLWVADAGNGRVLRFDNAATLASGASANAFLGTGVAVCSGAGLAFPAGLYADSSGGLWVADIVNNRVLRFASAATLPNSASASTVFGQPDLTTCIVAAPSATSMNSPASVYFDSGGRLWVADSSNNRVLRFDSASSLGNFPSASGVLGQADFTSAVAVVSQSGMNGPIGVFGDAVGHLFVSDGSNNRVLIHENAAAKPNGANADNVLGQDDFTTATFALTASNLNHPQGLAFDDSLGVLLVSDSFNNRVLGFTAPPTPTTSTTSTTAEPTTTSSTSTTAEPTTTSSTSTTAEPTTSSTSSTTTSTTAPTTTTLVTGPGQLLSGRVLVLKDDAERPSRRTMRVVSRDPALTLAGGPGSADDPTLHGALVRVVGVGFDVVYDIPATAWKYIGPSGSRRGYKARDAAPITRIVIKPGRLLVVAKGALLAHSLATDPQPVDVEVQLGSQPYCMTFGGTIAFTPDRSYRALNAPTAVACPVP